MKYVFIQRDLTHGESQDFIICEHCLKQLEPINQDKSTVLDCDQELKCEFCNN